MRAAVCAQGDVFHHAALTQQAHVLEGAAQAQRGKVARGVYVNQSAAFSDYHASGGNPAANASYTTLAFVADRFVVVQRREHA